MYHSFNCNKCGSNKLSYGKWVYATADVNTQPGGNITYGPTVIDEDSELGGFSTFICAGCKTPLYCGHWAIETERELLDYLKMTPEARERMQQRYQDYIDAEAERQEEMEECHDVGNYPRDEVLAEDVQN